MIISIIINVDTTLLFTFSLSFLIIKSVIASHIPIKIKNNIIGFKFTFPTIIILLTPVAINPANT